MRKNKRDIWKWYRGGLGHTYCFQCCKGKANWRCPPQLVFAKGLEMGPEEKDDRGGTPRKHIYNAILYKAVPLEEKNIIGENKDVKGR